MSLHTQLLRGLFVLPALLLLAVASVTAPAHALHAHAGTVAHARTVVIAEDGQTVIVTHADAGGH
ncbi:MAG: hypothetical protein HOQ02_05650 [Lysobacter sp.]|nr:hypothetical protein [Lysobacter sp.]